MSIRALFFYFMNEIYLYPPPPHRSQPKVSSGRGALNRQPLGVTRRRSMVNRRLAGNRPPVVTIRCNVEAPGVPNLPNQPNLFCCLILQENKSPRAPPSLWYGLRFGHMSGHVVHMSGPATPVRRAVFEAPAGRPCRSKAGGGRGQGEHGHLLDRCAAQQRTASAPAPAPARHRHRHRH